MPREGGGIKRDRAIRYHDSRLERFISPTLYSRHNYRHHSPGCTVKAVFWRKSLTADELIDLNRRKLLMAESRRVSTGLGADLTIEYDIRTPTNGIRQRVNRAAVKGKA